MRYQENGIVSHGKYTSLAALDNSRSDSGKPLLPGSSEINIPTPRPGNHPNYRRNNILDRKENLITRRRQLCQDMGRMAWPDEAWSARDEIMTIDDELAGGKDEA